MSEFEVHRTAAAKPETVFDVFTDHRGYANLVGMIKSSELEQEGQPAPNGLGAIRVIRLPGATVREQVTEFDRPTQYSYRMLSGAPSTTSSPPSPSARTAKGALTWPIWCPRTRRFTWPSRSSTSGEKSIVLFTDAAVSYDGLDRQMPVRWRAPGVH